MTPASGTLTIRPLSELDLGRITSIDERLTGVYRPEVWEGRVVYYLRRDPECCPVAEVDGKVVGFMFTDLRGGEFGLEEVCGWIERFRAPGCRWSSFRSPSLPPANTPRFSKSSGANRSPAKAKPAAK
jgi:hypothetical protein